MLLPPSIRMPSPVLPRAVAPVWLVPTLVSVTRFPSPDNRIPVPFSRTVMRAVAERTTLEPPLILMPMLHCLTWNPWMILELPLTGRQMKALVLPSTMTPAPDALISSAVPLRSGSEDAMTALAGDAGGN